MTYFEYLSNNKGEIQKNLDDMLVKYKVEPVGWGYIDCITLRDTLNGFVNEISNLGLAINYVTWWCYVNPASPLNDGCPHGMGGPKSKFFDGWFSELQSYEFGNDIEINVEMESYSKQKTTCLNHETYKAILKKLEKPFQYTPTDYIPENKCVMPALWMLVPEDWRNPF